MSTSKNVNLDYEVLKIYTDIVSSINSNDVDLAKDVVERIKGIQELPNECLAEIKDLLSPAVYNDVNDAHFYIIENIKDLDGMQLMYRMASIIFIQKCDDKKKLQYLNENANKEAIVTGSSAADCFYCSRLIQLAFNLKAFNVIDDIRDILNNYNLSGASEV